ncbi:hypothetical protein OAU35_00200 [bacterium]|nr:hypothetical protein [bacterium]
MAITNAQQYQQLVNKPANGKRPGYRGSSYGSPSRSSSQGPAGGASSGGNYGGNTNNSSNNNSSTNQGPAGGASAGGNYGGNVNVNQEYAGRAYEDQSYATQESVDNAKKREEVRRFQESLENDRKRTARNKRRLEEAALNKKNLFNKLGYIQRTKDENLEDLGAIDSQGLKIGKFEVPSFITGAANAFTIDPSTKYFDEDSIREIGSQTQYTKSIDPVTGKVTFGTTAKQADTLADLRQDIQMEDRVLSPDPDDAVTQSEFTDYMNRNKVDLPDNDGGDQQTDPCLGPNPPAYCNVGGDDEEDATPKRNLGGLAPRFAGSIFDFTGLADGGRAGAMDGGRMMNQEEDNPVGGIMDLETSRQMYGLGKLVKKITRGVKKVAKSPVGKAALMYFGGKALMGGMKGSSLFGKGPGSAFVKMFGANNTMPGFGNVSTAGMGGLFEKLGLVKGYGSMMPTIKGGIALASTLPLLMGQKEEEENNDDYYKTQGINIADIRNNPYKFMAPRFAADGGIMRNGYAEGSEEPVAKKTMPLLDMDGQEMDLREEGGFVPLGRMERADDVPARLSKNEFVFTADAVRNAGEGDVDKGAEVMYNMMKNLESGGDVSEESQGLEGAREMFQTSQRLEEVI